MNSSFHIALLGIALLVFGSSRAVGGRPLDEVKASTERIIALLKDPNLAGEERRAERRRLLIQEVDRRFDWESIARGCLGRHWSKASPQQREQFSDLFRRFLERTYLDKIEPYYDELLRVEYVSERVVDQNYASVKTVITTRRNVAHPVEYRLEKSASGEWRVYDAVIEGVSLVRNYRVQFDEILMRSSFDTLLKDLRSKAEGAD